MHDGAMQTRMIKKKNIVEYLMHPPYAFLANRIVVCNTVLFREIISHRPSLRGTGHTTRRISRLLVVHGR